MAIVSFNRQASKDEMAREIDRCHAVIERYEAELASRVAPVSQCDRCDGIADGVIAWLVSHGHLDAGGEVYVGDVIDALNGLIEEPAPVSQKEAEPVAWQNIAAPYSILTPEQYGMRLPMAEGRFRPLYASSAPAVDPATVADKIISEIEERFPNWRSYRDLIDCIDCTLHDLRSGIRSPAVEGK